MGTITFVPKTRVGDQITVKGLSIKMFLENPVDRTNTHYRIMLFRGTKVETFDHTSTFKNDSVNKMIHVINTERFTIKA